MRSVVLGLVIVGCAAAKNATAPNAVPTRAVEPASAAVSPSNQKPGAVSVEPFDTASPVLSILKPGPDESVPADGARGQPVVLDDGGFLDVNPGSRITVVLDGEAARDVTDVRAPLTLGGIDPLGRDPGPGEHVVVAVAVGPRGEATRFGPARKIASVTRRFFVGPPQGRAAGSTPMLVLLVPRGTYNGPVRAQSALLDFAILGGEIGADGLAVGVRVIGPRGTSDATLTGPGPYALRGLESGDHDIELQLRKPGGPLVGPWTRAIRTITVNLDGPAR